MDGVNGVFLLSRNLDSEFMVKCLQVLVNNFPEVGVTSVESDELHFGFRVYFLSPSADVVLARKSLLISGREVPIGPLRSLLTIYGVRKNGGQQYETDLRTAICNKFGKWLKDDSVPNSETFLQRNLRVWVDVPELEDLEIFRNEMFICLPGSNEQFAVKFHCRRCDRDGHFLQNCSNTLDDDADITDISEVSISSNTIPSFTFKSENTETRSNEDFSPSTSKFHRAFSLPSHKTSDPSSRSLDLGLKLASRSAFFEPTHATAVKVENITQAPATAFGVVNTAPTTTTADEEMYITTTKAITVGIKNPAPIPTTTVKFMDIVLTPTTAVGVTNTAPNPATAVRFTNITPTLATSVGFTNTAPKPATAVGFTNITPTPATAAGFANITPTTGTAAVFANPATTPSTSAGITNTGPTPTAVVEVTRTLSPRLQWIVDIACDEINVIDRYQLDNFFFFVKGKSNPLQYAKKYTNNVERLINLLQRIISLHYTSQPSQALTEHDKVFIKWLEGLVDRFGESILWRNSEGML